MAITVNNNPASYVDSTGGTHTINPTTGKETVVHSYSYNSKTEPEKATSAYKLKKFNEWHPETEAGDGTALGARKAYLEKQAAKEASGETSDSTAGSSSLTVVHSGDDAATRRTIRNTSTKKRFWMKTLPPRRNAARKPMNGRAERSPATPMRICAAPILRTGLPSVSFRRSWRRKGSPAGR
jgi:hypothetical protein